MKTKVLVVDDDRAIRNLLRRVVEDLGCEPVLAALERRRWRYSEPTRWTWS